MVRLFAVIAAATALNGQDGATRENWPHYGGQTSAWRYSAIDQVNAGNVAKLAPVWAFQTGDSEGGLQSTPIVVNGVMYLSTAHNRIFAIDAASGKERWSYYFELPKEFTIFYGPW